MDKAWLEKLNQKEANQDTILSFFDYMDKFSEDPYRESRPSFQYLLDMLNFYGKNSDDNYQLFETEHPDAPSVFGQKKILDQLVLNLKNFGEEGFNNKFILLVGPNGSSKSSIVRKLMKGAEEYSKTSEGPLYTFSWIFPIDSYVKGSLGLASTQEKSDLASFAYLDDKEISAIMASELKDHPLLLIPLEQRQQMLNECFADKPDYLESIQKSYLYLGDLSKRNRMIYDALLKNYKGDHKDVLKHIRVEKFEISKRYSIGAVTIEPQIHVDARMQQITMDKRLASLPPSLQSLNLYSISGEAILSNRGLLEFSDLLKRPLDTYKYLLQTMETGNINLQGILTQLDIFFIGTSNEIHLAAFKQHPDYNSFKGRFQFVKVPYLLDFNQEEKIYKEQTDSVKDRSIFEPHSLKALCIFAVLTRLRSSLAKNFEDKKLAAIVTALNPIQKALFLSERKVPDHLDTESRQILSQNYNEVAAEFEYDNLYQGKFGLSPRDIKVIIYKLADRHKNVTFVEIIDYLQKLITKKSEYDFLNMTPQADYHHPARFISLIKEYVLNILDREVRDSLGLVDARSYEEYIRRYIEIVKTKIKGEKIKNPITGKYENDSNYFTSEFEKAINLKESVENFHSHLISKLGAYSLDNPGKSISYVEVFPDIVERLKESFRIEQKKVIAEVSKNLVFFEAEYNGKDEGKGSPLNEEGRKEIQNILENLTSKYKYSINGAISVLKFLIKEKY